MSLVRSGSVAEVQDARAGGWRRSVRDYVTLAKPTITVLIVVTAFTGLWLASEGPPGLGLTLATLLGAGAAAGAGGVFNHYFDQDVDSLMQRTRDRPLPSGRVSPRRALLFGAGLLLFSVVGLSALVNLLAALLALAGFLIYVGVYTLWLKRRTPLNIVIGGAAGAIPPMIGWAAVTGRVELPAFLLFLIIFLWTPPHFWALALITREEYERAGIPMLPVVRGEAETVRQILQYIAVLVPVSLLLVPLGSAGGFYLAAALLLGIGFFARAWSLRREVNRSGAGRVFGYSIVYLFGLCFALVIDRLI